METESASPRAPGIWVVGLGPGSWSQLTIGALDRLLDADRILFRTLVHPTIEPLRARLRPGVTIQSFDQRYECAGSFDDLYQGIVTTLLNEAAAATRPIVYAVPGHPLVGERSVQLLLERAPKAGVTVAIVDGLSFLEPLLGALGIDPLAEGLRLVDGAALLDPDPPSPVTPWLARSPRLLQTGRPLVLGQIYDRRVASAAKLWLLERYPPEHQVTVVRAAGTADARISVVPLAELDHSAAFEHLTSIFVPALDPLLDVRALAALPYIAARLRAPDGCPWDREQTIESLKPHLLEEAFEAVAALDHHDPDSIAEELGDVLLLVTMLTQIAEEAGLLDLPQVVETVTAKLIRRHPHVFGDLTLGTAGAVVQNWERIKAGERQGRTSILSGVPSAMPALIASQVMQRKVAAFGFDWPTVQGVYDKVAEELDEVRQATPPDRLEEVGDLLFALVSLCRHFDLDAEEALRRANAKFRGRFERVEAACAARGLTLAELTPQALDALWVEAKATGSV